MKQTRIIIAGGRDFNDRALVEKCLIEACQDLDPEEVTVISGGAKGADAIGESLAREFTTNLCIYPANWDRYGKSAGHRRNALMAKNADQLIAFWDGKSRGTAGMIEIATKIGIQVTIINY